MIITHSPDIILHAEKNVQRLLLDCRGPLADLIKTIQGLTSVEHKIKTHLESPLRDHLKLVKFQSGNIILAADSAVWATQMKLQSLDILSQLRKERMFAGVISIQVKVDPALAAVAPSQKNVANEIKRHLPKHAAETLSELASKLDNDVLKNALRSLSENYD